MVGSLPPCAPPLHEHPHPHPLSPCATPPHPGSFPPSLPPCTPPSTNTPTPAPSLPAQHPPTLVSLPAHPPPSTPRSPVHPLSPPLSPHPGPLPLLTPPPSLCNTPHGSLPPSLPTHLPPPTPPPHAHSPLCHHPSARPRTWAGKEQNRNSSASSWRCLAWCTCHVVSVLPFQHRHLHCHPLPGRRAQVQKVNVLRKPLTSWVVTPKQL